MSIKGGRDYLYLIWKDPNSKRRYIVGELSKNGEFEFSYGHEVDAAIKQGFELLIAFPLKDKLYESEELFSVFASRLPDPKRKGIEQILEKYELTDYDSYKLLKRSGARLPIDHLEFIDPILNLEEGTVTRKLYLAGTGFHLGCNGETCCNKSFDVEVNENLRLTLEPENKYDAYAVKVLNQNDQQIGYLPRYLSKDISYLLKTNADVNCKIVEIGINAECTQCIKVELVISKP